MTGTDHDVTLRVADPSTPILRGPSWTFPVAKSDSSNDSKPLSLK